MGSLTSTTQTTRLNARLLSWFAGKSPDADLFAVKQKLIDAREQRRRADKKCELTTDRELIAHEIDSLCARAAMTFTEFRQQGRWHSSAHWDADADVAAAIMVPRNVVRETADALKVEIHWPPLIAEVGWQDEAA